MSLLMCRLSVMMTLGTVPLSNIRLPWVILPPVSQPPRRPTFHQREVVQQHVDKMVRNGIIAPLHAVIGRWKLIQLTERKQP